MERNGYRGVFVLLSVAGHVSLFPLLHEAAGKGLTVTRQSLSELLGGWGREGKVDGERPDGGVKVIFGDLWCLVMQEV